MSDGGRYQRWRSLCKRRWSLLAGISDGGRYKRWRSLCKRRWSLLAGISDGGRYKRWSLFSVSASEGRR